MTKLWNHTAVLGLYTLTPTHFGTGQAAGAVDLPIARDAATGFPVLPASGIKGVLRDYAQRDSDRGLSKDEVRELFGPEIGDDGPDEGLAAGALAFTEARLLAYPVRSLSAPFLHVTCPLIIAELARTLRATGGDKWLSVEAEAVGDPGNRALVTDQGRGGTPLVLEHLIYAGAEVAHAPALRTLAETLATLIPEGEKPTRQRFIDGLTMIPDADFAALMDSAIPVQARVKLTRGKTTDKWRNPETNQLESGNLWYEETLPADCMFVALIGERRLRGDRTPCLAKLVRAKECFAVAQIGGDETVGRGLCLCTVLAAPPDAPSAGASS